ncbi:MAG: hypothetical protein RL026_2703 [Pseudomonadota bacterium]|jgi:hypothetical protein
MKGVVFTEFLEMVEQRYSLDMVDDLLEEAAPASGGAYTAVGTYDHAEMAALVAALAVRTNTSVAELLRSFGRHLFSVFAAQYTQFFRGTGDALEFMAGIEDVIHAEVHKLYPDAELPRLPTEERGPDHLVLRYESSRHLEELAHGLIEGCVAHFRTALDIERSGGAGTSEPVRFRLTRRLA